MQLIRGYWKSILIGIGILYVSLLRDPGISLPTFVHADKWIHVVMYILLGATLCWDSLQIKLGDWRLWSIAIIGPMAYGGMLELVQEWWFAPRSGEWVDWLADCVGVVIGYVVIFAISRLSRGQNA